MSYNEMLKGKKAIITGGVRGIGYAIADAFAQAGADLLRPLPANLNRQARS